MKKIPYSVLGLLLAFNVSCTSDQKGTKSTTDTDTAANAEDSTSPTAATSSAGSGGMGGAVSSHALASDSLTSDTTSQR